MENVISLSAADADGYIPDNIVSIEFALSWRLDSSALIYIGTAAVQTNSDTGEKYFNLTLPKRYSNPDCLKLYGEFFWLDPDSDLKTRFTLAAVTVNDSANTGFVPEYLKFDFPNQAEIEFMSGVYYVNGKKIQCKIVQTGIAPDEGTAVWTTIFADPINNALTMFSIGAQTASVGNAVIVEIYKDGLATGTTITLPAGQTDPVDAVINVSVE